MNRHNSIRIIKLLTLTSIIGMVTSCTNLEDIENFSGNGELIFSAQMADNWQDMQDGSRANTKTTYTSQQLDSTELWLNTKVEEIPDSVVLDNKSANTKAAEKTSIIAGEKMGVYATLKAGEVVSEYMNNQMVELTANGWEYSPIKYWPTNKNSKIDFYAYMPYYEGTDIVTDNTNKTITYSVPADVAGQIDLIAAKTTDVTLNSSSGNVDFNFKHILTAIKFKTNSGIQTGTITRVALKGVSNSGTYNLVNESWDVSDNTGDYIQNINVPTINGTQDTPITSETGIFMMIPQVLPDDATIEIDFTYDTGVKRTLTKPIKEITSEWKKGAVITYMISNSPLEWTYTLDIKVDGVQTTDLSVGYGGEYKKFEITSSRKKEGGEDEAVEWQTQFSTDGGNTWKSFEDIEDDYNWLSNITLNGTDITTTCTAEVLSQPFNSGDANVIALNNKPEVGSSTNYSDLSNGAETSNCYIINAPGYYKLPLIYGNARNADGSNNTQAYAPTGCPAFKDYNNNPISQPKITIPTGSDATLVWQDAPGVIKDVKLDDNSEYLQFFVDKEYIRPCNAIVAVRDNNDVIMWSWHIWVTPYVLGEGDGTATINGKSYTFMAINLGWCNDIDQSSYGTVERSIKIKIIQHQGLEKIITLTQDCKTDYEIKRGESPYYQWGRKDPSPSVNGNRTFVGSQGAVEYYHDKETFGPYTFGVTPDNNPKSLGYSIQNPHLFIDFPTSGSKYGHWCVEDEEERTNYWNATRNTDAGWRAEARVEDNIKSVYDPCPVGYKVPVHNALRGVYDGSLTDNGFNNQSEITYVNSGDDSDYYNFSDRFNIVQARSFYDVKKWYLLGMRTSGGLLREVTNDELPSPIGIQGYYHSASGFKELSYRSLHIYLSEKNKSLRVASEIAWYRGEGHNIRPVRDE